MIASGVNSEAKGMAPLATIVARKSDNDEAEMSDFAASGGIISNHSYSTGDPDGETELYGIYDGKAAEWDDIAYYAPYYLICKSAGNNRNDGVNVSDNGYDIIYTVSGSKNILTVGAVYDVLDYLDPSSVVQSNFSNWGPTDDWRIKPDITTNGVGIYSSNDNSSSDYSTKNGTSMAVAVATGTLTLLQQHYYNLNNKYMKSATAKALVICTADEVGAHDGPDFQSGWGLLNAEKSAELITNNTAVFSATSLISEEILTNGDTFSFDIEVDGASPVSMVVSWVDISGNPMIGIDNQSPVLINDLDVRIVGNDATYYPWVMTPNSSSNNFTDAAEKGDNFRDNVERIDISSLAAGNYKVLVTHKGSLLTGKQDFSLVMSGIISSSLKLDSDSDGVYDYKDNCPSKHNTNQLDTDSDGVGDVCDEDDDNDGMLDENDNCSIIENSNQLDTDDDGVGDVCDTDDDNDGILDENDNCPLIANNEQLDFDKDGIGDSCDQDMDGDRVLNEDDVCDNTPINSPTDENGCAIFTLSSKNFKVEVYDETCRSKNNGYIILTAIENLNYIGIVTINGDSTEYNFTETITFENLASGDYSICIKVENESTFEQCFDVHVTEPEKLEVLSKLNSNSVQLSLKGGDMYYVKLNNEILQTSIEALELNLKSGKNTLHVVTNVACKGEYVETFIIPFKGVNLYPNPVSQGGRLYLTTGGINDETIDVSIYSTLGSLIYKNKHKNNKERRLEVDVTSIPKGAYIVKLKSSEYNKSYTLLID
mgnify:CR=1 FL=1